MKIAVFDHMDRGAVPLREHYSNRLRLIETYDEVGFDGYHLAEHHATPLGIAPSPSVFLAAVAQRTRRMRLGPLVYTLSMHHPLRVIEEICMLDQLSGGRLDLGIGRGVSPFEIGYYGVDPQKAQQIYLESFQVIMQGLTHKTVDFHGEHFNFSNVPMEMECLQKPVPPLWYGLGTVEGAKWAADNGVNVVCNGPAVAVRRITDTYRQHWLDAGRNLAQLPRVGVSRHIIVADTDEAAQRIAEHAYTRWRASLMHLWVKHGSAPTHLALAFPETFAGAQESGMGIAGSPDTVRAWALREVERCGVNYLVCRVAFGDMPVDDALRSVRLFSQHVMPELRAATAGSELCA